MLFSDGVRRRAIMVVCVPGDVGKNEPRLIVPTIVSPITNMSIAVVFKKKNHTYTFSQ